MVRTLGQVWIVICLIYKSSHCALGAIKRGVSGWEVVSCGPLCQHHFLTPGFLFMATAARAEFPSTCGTGTVVALA